VLQACAKDFVMMTAALELEDLSDVTDCKNAQGQAVGIPNYAGIALNPLESCSPLAFPGGDTYLCATYNDHPQTFAATIGDTRYFLSKYKNLHGIYIYDNDVPVVGYGLIPDFTVSEHLGIKGDGLGIYSAADAAPESALTPFIQVIKNDHSTYVNDGVSPGSLVLLEREAALQKVTSVKVWTGNQGDYDNAFIQQGGPLVNGTYTSIFFLPFYTECHDNAALSALAKQVGGCSKLQGNAMESYIDALLFQSMVQKVVASGKTLNRANLLAAKSQETSFNADGIVGPEDLANPKAGVDCIVMVRVIKGEWQRVYPPKPGTFDCSSKNETTIKLNLIK
jgi:hypothetical protein